MYILIALGIFAVILYLLYKHDPMAALGLTVIALGLFIATVMSIMSIYVLGIMFLAPFGVFGKSFQSVGIAIIPVITLPFCLHLLGFISEDTFLHWAVIGSIAWGFALGIYFSNEEAA